MSIYVAALFFMIGTAIATFLLKAKREAIPEIISKIIFLGGFLFLWYIMNL